MLECRRGYTSDSRFFKSTEIWEWLTHDDDNWSIMKYRGPNTEDYKRKAGVVAFDERVRLSVDERLWDNAAKGQMFANFVLAHELAHVALDHHSKGAVTKNFQLFDGPSGQCNIPPTVEELEANYGAVCFQCGAALEDPRWDSVTL